MKKNILFLSILLPLSLGAMEESTAASSAREEKINRLLDDFTLDKFDDHQSDNDRFVKSFLLQTEPGRESLIISKAHFVRACNSFSPDSSVVSAFQYHSHMHGWDPITGSNALIVLCKHIAQLERLLTTHSKMSIDRKIIFETERHNSLILLYNTVMHDNSEMVQSAYPQDLPDYFKNTHREWPPFSKPSGIFSPLSSFTVVREALTRRVALKTDYRKITHKFQCERDVVTTKADPKSKE